MSNPNRKWISSIVAGVLAVGVVAGCSSSGGQSSSSSAADSTGSTAGASGKAIEIGVSASLTGNWAFVGTDGVNGMKLAAEQINSTGGIDGRPIKLDIEDNGSSASQALPQMSKFVSNSAVLAVLGATASALVTPLASVGNAKKLFVGGVDANSPAIGQTGPYAMSMSDGNADLQAPLAEYAVKHSGDRLAAVNDTDNSAYVSLADQFGIDVKSQGGQIVSREGLLSTTQDVNAVVSKIAAHKINGVFLGVVPTQTATFVEELRKAVGPDVGLYAPFGDAVDDFLTAGGSAINGVVVSANFGAGSSPAAQKFASAFQAKYNKAADDPAAIGYGAIEFIAARLSKASDVNSLTREQVQQLITAPGSEKSVLGHGTMTITKGRQVTYPAAVLKVENGKFVLAS